MIPPTSPQWCEPHPISAHPTPRDGRRHCGYLESVIRRQWDPADGAPDPSLIRAVDRLAELPVHLATRLADWLEGLWLGAGTVTDLDDLGHLRGQLVAPGSAATWDQVPGVLYGRVIAVGTADHVSASLLDHELGHALERMDQMADQAEWRTIMFRCRPLLLIDRWTDQYEWWAEGWAFTVTGQLGRLVRMLNGHEEVAEMVTAYYRRHYGLMGGMR